VAKPRFLQGLLSKKGVFWREVLPSYTYSELDRTVILSHSTNQPRNVRRCPVSLRLILSLEGVTSLELFHGVFKIPVEEQELRELRERLEKFEEIPSVFILPKMPGEF